MAAVSIMVIFLLVGLIHVFAPAKQWGDLTQALIYHQVRKYLLRLDVRKQHVKFWRPQVLLLVNNPRTSYNLIDFSNSLKKGSLYILGHVLVSHDFQDSLNEYRKQVFHCLKLVDHMKNKAFVEVSISSNERLGAQGLIMV